MRRAGTFNRFSQTKLRGRGTNCSANPFQCTCGAAQCSALQEEQRKGTERKGNGAREKEEESVPRQTKTKTPTAGTRKYRSKRRGGEADKGIQLSRAIQAEWKKIYRIMLGKRHQRAAVVFLLAAASFFSSICICCLTRWVVFIRQYNRLAT